MSLAYLDPGNLEADLQSGVNNISRVAEANYHLVLGLHGFSIVLGHAAGSCSRSSPAVSQR